jgi:hypothetical protein
MKRFRRLNKGVFRLHLVIAGLLSLTLLLMYLGNRYYISVQEDLLTGAVAVVVPFVGYLLVVRIVLWVIDGFREGTP